jgi:hypothetical protein
MTQVELPSPRQRRSRRRRTQRHTVYAAHTKVPIDRTKTEIEHTLRRYGADRFAYFTEAGKAIIVFEAHERRLRFNLPLPVGESEKDAQAWWQKWRALLLCIKAKLESVESKIESFEEAFLAHVVMPDGRTVAEHTIPAIASIYQGGPMQALLPAPQ